MTDVRLAIVRKHDDTCLKRLPAPALLVSYFYLSNFERYRNQWIFRDWVMDSGAFSAHNSNKKINLDLYIDTCRRLLSNDVKLTEVFALDEIGDWRVSLKNTKKMWTNQVPAIPVYHYGEPVDLLLGLASDYPKIALGGAVGLSTKEKKRWAITCLSKIWPKRVHGLGFSSENILMEVPFHSCDASTWQLGPYGFGRWKTYGKALRMPSDIVDLRVEVDYYLELETKLKWKWKKEMKELA